MKIARKTLTYINQNITDFPPETGGILGSKNGDIITQVILDRQDNKTKYMCFYSPNTSFLNSCIEKWQKEEILFKGIFHTHFAGIQSLSCADEKYITNIMEVMPEKIMYLYFPIFVLPNRELVVYRASRRNTEIYIERDFLEVI